jgi:hypothetical protein
MVLSMEHEATHELDRRTGVVSLHPYWDVDLVSLLYRTPIGILSRGGRSKGLVRESVNRRLPGLGFKVQKKTGASRLYEQIIYNEGPQIWRAIDGTIQLDELGIADRRAVDGLMRSMFARRPEWESSRIWGLLLLETWTRSRKQAGRHI